MEKDNIIIRFNLPLINNDNSLHSQVLFQNRQQGPTQHLFNLIADKEVNS
jgi:hypothetical protein